MVHLDHADETRPTYLSQLVLDRRTTARPYAAGAPRWPQLFDGIVWSCRIVLDDDDGRRAVAARNACWLTDNACPRATRLGQRHDPGNPQSQYTKSDEGD